MFRSYHGHSYTVTEINDDFSLNSPIFLTARGSFIVPAEGGRPLGILEQLFVWNCLPQSIRLIDDHEQFFFI